MGSTDLAAPDPATRVVIGQVHPALRRPALLRAALLGFVAVALAAVLVGCGSGEQQAPLPRRPAPGLAGGASPSPVCGLWMAIGAEPTDAQLVDAARRYPVVVLNAWEVAAQRRLRALNPAVTVLVYKDLSSTRSYSAGVDGVLPTGVGYDTSPADWFATDTGGRRVEWGDYPGHWQMAVWDAGYRDAWTTSVADETVRNGWDGVFADNDFADLEFYSDAVLAGTSGARDGDELVRDGLDRLVDTAGSALAARGKLLVPNLSEARLYPGRWTEHARFGGAMEENFAQSGDGGLLTWQGDQWDEMLRTGSDQQHLNLLVTKLDGTRDAATERAGFVGAALLAGDRTCWTLRTSTDYSRPAWSSYQSLRLGAASGPAELDGSGVWTRSFDGGWVALNPGDSAVTVTPPDGLRTTSGESVTGDLTIPAADGTVLLR